VKFDVNILVALFLAGGSSSSTVEVVQPVQEDYLCRTGIPNVGLTASEAVGGSLNGVPVVCGGLNGFSKKGN